MLSLMPPELTAADCLVACERLAARLDLMRAELQALPPAVSPCDPDALGSDTL